MSVRKSVFLAVAALASVCASEPQMAAPAQVRADTAAKQSGYSSADSLLLLLNTAGTFEVLRMHIPFFVNLTEHGLIPAFPTDMTLDDLLAVPESKLTPEILRDMNAELAKIPRDEGSASP